MLTATQQLVQLCRNAFGVDAIGKLIGQFLQRKMEGVASATFSIGTESGGDAIVVSIQLKDADGRDIASVQGVTIGLFTSADCTTFNSGDYTIAAGTDGALVELVADKLLFCTCEADGDLDISLTLTGAGTVYLALFDGDGKILSVSGAITHAA